MSAPAYGEPAARQFPYTTTLATPSGPVRVSIEVMSWSDSDEPDLYFCYEGDPGVLVSCGAITAELMAKGPRGRQKVDEDGDRCRREHHKRFTRVTRRKSLASAGTAAMPGFETWMPDAAAKCMQEHELEERRRREAEQASPPDPCLQWDFWRSLVESNFRYTQHIISAASSKPIDRRCSAESVARMHAIVDRCMAEVLPEMDKARLVVPANKAAIRLVIDNTRGD